ncbi:SRPBCC family protein [Methylococcus sp. ANG]|uniref:SRPBCC family protein n=1 Tax=Methylococcus sp. ANG TaxID=3231903 RepID=UPI0034585823
MRQVRGLAPCPAHLCIDQTRYVSSPADYPHQHATQKIFPFIDDLHAWLDWSPYEKKDPEMKRTFGGPAAGVGARYARDGSRGIGAGSMEITESQPSSRVVMKRDSARPFAVHNIVEFSPEPEGEPPRR